MSHQRSPVFRAAKLSEQVYSHLLRQISTQTVPPGAPLREQDLVAQLGVSRTPIRQALVRLAENGLVQLSGRSAQVRRLNREDIRHVYQVRRALEDTAVRLACGRFTAADFAHLDALTPVGREGEPVFNEACFQLDIELHRLIALRSGNTILAQEICKFHDVVQLVHKSVAESSGRLAEELRQHQQIIVALKKGDRRASRKALLDHLRSSYQTQVHCVRAATRRGSAARADGAEHGSRSQQASSGS